MATSQMNVRIDEAVKAMGDSVFESIGYTPTRVIRALWNYAAHCAGQTDELEELLRIAEECGNNLEETRMHKVRLAERGPDTFDSFLRDMGISTPFAFAESTLTPAELREQAAIERATQKGWIHD